MLAAVLMLVGGDEVMEYVRCDPVCWDSCVLFLCLFFAADQRDSFLFESEGCNAAYSV